MTPEAIDVIVAENASLKEEIRRLRDEIAELKERVEWFTRQIYGQKSERYVPAVEGQTELDLGVAPTAQQPQQNEHIAYDRKKAARHTPHGREEIPSHLPRKQQIILPSEDVSGMEKILGSYRGILQTDCYAAYDRYSRMEHIIHAGCHAHARRGFDESMQGDKSRATYALELYRSLFAIEQEARTAGMDHARRLAYRQEKALPVLLAFKSWLDENVRQVKPKSAIGKAILYCLNHWNRLIRYLDDGRIEISNNLVENCIRPLAIGRKNWLFAGSESMAKMMGDIYTVQGTCKLHGINFFTYLTALLEELPNRTGTASAIDDLLPMNWKPEVQA